MRSILFFVLFILYMSTATHDGDLAMLKNMKKLIDDDYTIHYQSAGDQMEPAAAIFLKGFWKPMIQNESILVHVFRLDTARIGNFLGNYFDAISCALETGMHYISVKKSLQGHHKSVHDPFYDAFPDIMVNENPVDYEVAQRNTKEKCSCTRYCWYATDPWTKQIPLIRKLLTHAVDLHLTMIDKHGRTAEQRGLVIDSQIDICSAAEGEFLPLFPDFALHFRCSDNIFGGMGLIAFESIIERIPKNAKYIYVFTEHGTRLDKTVLESSAPIILKALYDDIRTAFPAATVVVKKGGNEITIWAQFTYANVTFCSPSTYCFWPAIARTNTTYMPATDYIAGHHGMHGGGVHTAIHDNYHWIYQPKIFNNFTTTTPTADILRTLRGA